MQTLCLLACTPCTTSLPRNTLIHRNGERTFQFSLQLIWKKLRRAALYDFDKSSKEYERHATSSDCANLIARNGRAVKLFVSQLIRLVSETMFRLYIEQNDTRRLVCDESQPDTKECRTNWWSFNMRKQFTYCLLARAPILKRKSACMVDLRDLDAGEKRLHGDSEPIIRIFKPSFCWACLVSFFSLAIYSANVTRQILTSQFPSGRAIRSCRSSAAETLLLALQGVGAPRFPPQDHYQYYLSFNRRRSVLA